MIVEARLARPFGEAEGLALSSSWIFRLCFTLILCLGTCAAVPPVFAEDAVSPLRTAINQELATRATPAIGRDIDILDRVYWARGDRPAWTDDNGLSERGRTVVATLATADRDGLEASRYVVDVPVTKPLTPDAIARLELSVSAALVRYARDLRGGRVRPQTFDPDQHVLPPPFDGPAVLYSAMEAPDLPAYLAALQPATHLYTGLRNALAAYRGIASNGGWPSVPGGPTLRPGEDDPRVPVLRRRLHATGELTGSNLKSSHFDDELAAAVERFQDRHGLVTDGTVGPATLEAMNVPVAQRIRQILINMERQRWMPDSLGDPHVFVNMASFELDVVRDRRSVLNMRVVVGKPARSTPVFSDEISIIEFNPYWYVPRSIATKDLLPKVRRNPSYFASENIRVFAPGDGGMVEVPASSVNWGAYSTNHFPFRLRQDPGEKNALGHIKFLFPNEFDVYLHDTPSRGLFARNVRTFSSGCIRVEKPEDLAVELLRSEGDWSKERIEKIIAREQRRSVQLKQPIPIHLAYVTAWSDATGTVHFREDIYGRDRLLAAAVFG